MNQTEDILKFANVKLGEVLLWMKNNPQTTVIGANQFIVVEKMLKDKASVHTLALKFNVTNARIYSVFHSSLRRLCTFITAEKQNLLNPDAVRNFELTFNANDASIPSAKLSEKEIVVLLKKSIYSILWADKIVMAFKRNEILYWGDLVVAYRKLYFTPKLGNKSLVVIETELAKQGLKFVDKNIAPQRKNIEGTIAIAK